MYKDFTEMPVWKQSMEIAESIFKITISLPREEDYALKSQLRRASVSISSNIAEGFGRVGNKDKINFYVIARGSAFEVKSQLIYGQKVNYFKQHEVNDIVLVIENFIFEINKLIKSFKP